MVRYRFMALALTVTLAVAGTSFASPVPSKTAPDQTVAAREADLNAVQAVAGNEQVVKSLAAQGFSQDQINTRLATLSDQDLHNLARNLDQIQAAGMSRKAWIWIGVGAAATTLSLWFGGAL
jgi:membrane-bound lytic murein transglycosylase B